MPNYQQIAKDARLRVLDLIYGAQTSHIGSNFSCIDILTVLFENIDLDKDKFMLSKGWAAASLYYFLWRKGRITEEELNSFCKEGSKFIGLAEPITPDIMIAGGSMGLGLPGAVGLALAKKIKKEEGKVYVLMSDGEMQIGTAWESALIIKHHKLDNLVVIVDCNGLQAMGKVDDVLSMPIEIDIDGHDYGEIEKALDEHSGEDFIFAKTIKGKGWKRAEGDNIYHYKSPSYNEYIEALTELNEGILSKSHLPELPKTI